MTYSSLTAFFDRFARSVARMRWSHAAVLISVVFAAANFELITDGAHEKWDAQGLAAPYFSLLASFARAGRVLLWNPWTAGGSPDFAVAGSATFSPDLLLFAAISGGSERAYVFCWLTVWLAGGFGMLLLARHLRAPVWLGFTVACGYLFSGFYTGQAEHLSVIYSHTLLTFVVWRFDDALKRANFLAAAQAGVLLGMSGLAGYPALTLGSGTVACAWWAGRVFLPGPSPCAAKWKRAIVLAFVTFALAGVVLFPSLYAAAYETPGYSDRSNPLSREFALTSNALHPGAIATLSSPAFAAVKLDRPSLWEYTDVSGVSLYTGSATIFLACAALLARRARAWKYAVFCGGALALICALSYALPVRGWLYDLLPVTQYFRHASMLRGYFLFSLSVLALVAVPPRGFDRRLWQRRSLVFVLPAVCALLAFATVAVATRANFTGVNFAGFHCAFVWIGPGIIAAFTLQRPRNVRLLPAFFVLLSLTDALMNYSLSSCTVSDMGPALARTRSNSNLSFDRALGASGENTNLYNQTATFKSYAPLKNLCYEYTASYPQLGFIALGRDRVWFAHDVPEINVNQSSFESFKEQVTQSDGPLFVRHSRGVMLGQVDRTRDATSALSNARRPQRVAVQVTTYTPEKVLLDTIAPTDGWLMVTERWSRSWHATVNGKEEPISGANFIFRALPVKQGPVHIAFDYTPPFIFALLRVSWSAVALVLVLTIALPTARRLRSFLRSGVSFIPGLQLAK